MHHQWHPLLRQWVAIGIIALSLLAVRILWPFLTPLSLSLLLTYILIPVVDRVERNTGWPRTGAAGFVYGLLLVFIVLIPATVLPAIVEQVQAVTPALVAGLEQLGDQIAGLGTLTIFGQALDLYDFYLQLTGQIVNLGTAIASSSFNIVFGFATTFLSTILWLLFILVISFYVVRDSPNISRYFWGLIPHEARPEVYYLTRRIDRTWNAFLRGQLVLSTVIFVVTTLALMILGVPQAFFLGVLAGILNLVPNLGPILSAIPAVMIALVQGSTHFGMSNLLFALLVVGAYTLIQQLESNLLVPRIIGGSVQLHPAVVILGAIIGLSTVGILGIFLAAPTLASLRVIGGFAYHKLLDPDFEPDVTIPDSIQTISDPRERPIVPLSLPTPPSDRPRWRSWVLRYLQPTSPPPDDTAPDA